MKQQAEIPLQELIKLKPKFVTIISHFGIRSYTVQDILQDFFLKILRQSERDGLNYLERYDGSSTLATWLYKPLQNLCKTLKTRENSKRGLAITTAAKIEEAPEREQDFDGSTLYLENFKPSEEADVSDLLLAKQLLDIAKRRYSNYSSQSEKRNLPRSVYVIVQFLYNGLTKAQVARVLEVSSTYVDTQVRRFQNDPEVLKLKEEWLASRC